MGFAIRHPFIDFFTAAICYPKRCSCKSFTCISINFINLYRCLSILHRNILDIFGISHRKFYRISQCISVWRFNFGKRISLAYNQALNLMSFAIGYPFIYFFTAGIRHSKRCPCKPISAFIHFVNPDRCQIIRYFKNIATIKFY